MHSKPTHAETVKFQCESVLGTVECYVLRVNGDVNNYKIIIIGSCRVVSPNVQQFSRTIRSRIQIDFKSSMRVNYEEYLL